MDLTDEALVAKFRQTKDPNLFKSLVRRYENRLFNAAYRILGNAEEAEEVVQDTCIKLHQNLPKFRTNLSFGAWLFRIAHNTCLDKMRLKQRRQGYNAWSFDPQAAEDGEDAAPNVVAQAADPSMTPSEKIDLREQGTIVAESLNKLPENQRTVIVLHDIEGFSYEEISEIVGANLGTVRSRLHYGRVKLKELLDPYFSASNVAKSSR